ncbi:MAG: UvrD-helicase domain-containing protein [Lachnospiraceae bacterium]|nr:UvrD-helicase domain-containing protein [Lachnospiraceae bacterium]
MADLLENLNDKQREAVLETEGYVRVIAGAGSGKTKLLVSRYAYLVQEYGIDSSNILCVTFTNKAAGEMKRRIRALIGSEYDFGLICTYHGFCNRLLRENPEKLFLNKQFQIIDNQQQKAILGEIYQKYELKLDYASFESILRKIRYAKKDGTYVTKLCNPQPCQILHEIKKQDDHIIEEFLQRQKATYSLDFQDLIAFAIHLLETDAEVREKWQNRLNYIMVDEFQDSSKVEMRLLDILSDRYHNLMIVGDPDQNIYEWRGSDVGLLVDFDKDHEPTQTIILNQNYRSTPQILKCANTLIEKNQQRVKKDLFTKNAAGAPVIHYHSRNDSEEMDHVIENIKKLHASGGFRYSDFAIIYRSSFLSRVVEKKLVEKNIPYEIFGGVRFYQRMEVLDILAYLKLIAYDDDICFRRIVNTPRRRFGRAKMNFLEGLKASDRSLFAALSMHLETKEFQNSEAAEFVHFIDSMRKRYQEMRISDIVNEVTGNSGYEAYIREMGDEERLDNLAEFKRIANEFEREFGENLSLEEFLQQIALQSGEDREDQKDTVKLMTIHSSKGLEFPAVFILGFTEGVFPSSKTIGERKKPGLEEERRLCYVAITRAEKYLFLMESEGAAQNGMQKLVSRFIEEIGETNYVRIGQISEDLMHESRRYAANLNREMQMESDDTRKVGDVVEHHIFGRGVIEAIDTKRASYQIRFEKLAQPRSISIRYFAQKHEEESLKPAEQPGSADYYCGG